MEGGEEGGKEEGEKEGGSEVNLCVKQASANSWSLSSSREHMYSPVCSLLNCEFHFSGGVAHEQVHMSPLPLAVLLRL